MYEVFLVLLSDEKLIAIKLVILSALLNKVLMFLLVAGSSPLQFACIQLMHVLV